jgi:hypothetical protein
MTHTESEEQSMEPGSRVQKFAVDFLEIGDIVRVPTGSTPPIKKLLFHLPPPSLG